MTNDNQMTETFTVGERPQLSVANIRGTIAVTGEERQDICVTAVKHLDDCRNPKDTEIRLYQEGDRVVAKTRYRHDKRGSKRGSGSQACAVDYDVRIPAHCDVGVSQVKGTIHVSGVIGRVTVNAVQGEVNLDEIIGDTQVKAVNAAVEGKGWSGQAHVNTVSGPVQIDQARLSRVKANTVSADVSIETTIDDEGHYDLNSVSGDVTLCLPADRGVTSRGSTLSGRLVCDLPHVYSRRSRGRWDASINGGGPQVRFNSVSGDLEVLSTSTGDERR